VKGGGKRRKKGIWDIVPGVNAGLLREWIRHRGSAIL